MHTLLLIISYIVLIRQCSAQIPDCIEISEAGATIANQRYVISSTPAVGQQYQYEGVTWPMVTLQLPHLAQISGSTSWTWTSRPGATPPYTSVVSGVGGLLQGWTVTTTATSGQSQYGAPAPVVRTVLCSPERAAPVITSLTASGGCSPPADSRVGLRNCPLDGSGVLLTFTGFNFGLAGARADAVCRSGSELQWNSDQLVCLLKAAVIQQPRVDVILTTPDGGSSNAVTLEYAQIADCVAIDQTSAVSANQKYVFVAGSNLNTRYDRVWRGAVHPQFEMRIAIPHSRNPWVLFERTSQYGDIPLYMTSDVGVNAMFGTWRVFSSFSQVVQAGYQEPSVYGNAWSYGPHAPVITRVDCDAAPQIVQITSAECTDDGHGGLRNCPFEGGVTITIRGVSLGWWGARADNVCIDTMTHRENSQSTVEVQCVLRPAGENAGKRVAVDVTVFPTGRRSNQLHLQYQARPFGPILTYVVGKQCDPLYSNRHVLIGQYNCPHRGDITVTLVGLGFGASGATSNICREGSVQHTAGKVDSEITCTLVPSPGNIYDNGSGVTGEMHAVVTTAMGLQTPQSFSIKYGAISTLPHIKWIGINSDGDTGGCTANQENGGLDNCMSAGGITITLYGSNFGWWGLYSNVCEKNSVVHDTVRPQELVTCKLVALSSLGNDERQWRAVAAVVQRWEDNVQSVVDQGPPLRGVISYAAARQPYLERITASSGACHTHDQGLAFCPISGLDPSTGKRIILTMQGQNFGYWGAKAHMICDDDGVVQHQSERQVTCPLKSGVGTVNVQLTTWADNLTSGNSVAVSYASQQQQHQQQQQQQQQQQLYYDYDWYGAGGQWTQRFGWQHYCVCHVVDYPTQWTSSTSCEQAWSQAQNDRCVYNLNQ